MEISNIKISRTQKETLHVKAIVTLTFDNFIIIKDVKIVNVRDNMTVIMPSQKISTGEFKDLCNPITPEFKKYIINNSINNY